MLMRAMEREEHEAGTSLMEQVFQLISTDFKLVIPKGEACWLLFCCLDSEVYMSVTLYKNSGIFRTYLARSLGDAEVKKYANERMSRADSSFFALP